MKRIIIALAKVAILVDPERGWNGSDRYHPGDAFEVRKWSDGKTVWRFDSVPESGDATSTNSASTYPG